MILHVDSDAAYLVCPEARSRAGGYHYLGNKDGKLINAPVFVLAKVIKNVMASASEAELGALYMNGQEACALRTCLMDLGHEQGATPMKTDNSVADGIIRGTIKQKRSKAIDMRFYWLRDRYNRGQFKIFWERGKNNLADYPTKHHPPTHHKRVRPVYLYIEGKSPKTLQGCIELLLPVPRDRTEGRTAGTAGAARALHLTVTPKQNGFELGSKTHSLPAILYPLKNIISSLLTSLTEGLIY